MLQVIKSDGSPESFSEEKVLESITRAGIPKDMQQKVLLHVKEKLFDGITTSEIHNHIREFLFTSKNSQFIVKYDLKRAIMSLGPTGYPFEDYVAKLLEHQGYEIKTRTIVHGSCITHEIDVIAKKDNKTTMVEAKFHNSTGVVTDVHVALYTQARFLDAKEKNDFHEAFLITNTRATTDAIAYANCVGMRIVSWSYPEGNSLRDWIETFSLYPITAITALTNSQKAQLLQHDIVLCQDLCKNKTALNALELSEKQKEKIIAEASFACAR